MNEWRHAALAYVLDELALAEHAQTERNLRGLNMRRQPTGASDSNLVLKSQKPQVADDLSIRPVHGKPISSSRSQSAKIDGRVSNPPPMVFGEATRAKTSEGT